MEASIEAARRPRTQLVPTTPVDADRLAADLRAGIVGEVRFEAGDRALWATDAGNYRQIPIGVVLPRSVDDVIRAIDSAREHRAPILPRGGGTSLAGQCCNVAVVLDFSKYLSGVTAIDPERRRARVLPGTTLDELRAAAGRHGLTFGPDPATHAYCTLGGMIGNDSCGPHSIMAEFHGPGARTSDNVVELEVVTYDGTRLRVGPTSDDELERIIRGGGRRAEIYARLRDLRDRYADRIRAGFPQMLRRVSGYNLPALLPENGFNIAQALVGSEGTCATVLEATVELIRSPLRRSLLVLGYRDVYEAGDHIPEIRSVRPAAIEGFDDTLLGYVRQKGMYARELELLPTGGGWLLVEFAADTRAQANARAHDLMDRLSGARRAPQMVLYDEPAVQERIWNIRESGLGATAFVPGESDTWPGWEDSAVPVERIGDYLRDLRALLDRYGYHCALYGHFGQGCVHTRIDFDLTTIDGLHRYRDFAHEAAELVANEYGGSLSGEHGDGQARGELLPIMYGGELMRAFREFRDVWDPDRTMNPGKAIDAAPLSENLRLGPDYAPPAPATHFHYPEDGGSFSHAALRCVGVGKCRRTEGDDPLAGGDTMCPSYMVLKEEKHTTRGRAHLLFEMLQGDVVTEAWRSEPVKEALDLCLSCKGCKGECPVNVDMATYKAEFLSRYYQERRRPRSAYAFGLVHWWARAAAHVPGLVNWAAGAPGVGSLIRAAAGIHPDRRLPRFAPRTFRTWWRDRQRRRRASTPAVAAERPRVLLWPDTFNNHFSPRVLAAGAELLEAAGHRVIIPEPVLCCGRPLYEFGMLDRATEQLRQVLGALRPEIEAGTPLVGLEPGCTAVFRDELVNLLPHDENARRLAGRTFTLAEFLRDEADGFDPPRISGDAVVHGHCHHKAIMGIHADVEVLDGTGVDYRLLASGCCGMAGSFGFERDKYDVAMGAGERVLLPAVRAAGPDAFIIANGFSCREQIAHGTDRHALHLAELLRLGARRHTPLSAGRRAEDAAETVVPDGLAAHGPTRAEGALAIGAGVAAAGALSWLIMRD